MKLGTQLNRYSQDRAKNEVYVFNKLQIVNVQHTINITDCEMELIIYTFFSFLDKFLDELSLIQNKFTNNRAI